MAQQEDPDLAGSESKEQDAESLDDVALRPGPNADAAADVERYISAEVRALYDADWHVDRVDRRPIPPDHPGFVAGVSRLQTAVFALRRR